VLSFCSFPAHGHDAVDVRVVSMCPGCGVVIQSDIILALRSSSIAIVYLYRPTNVLVLLHFAQLQFLQPLLEPWASRRRGVKLRPFTYVYAYLSNITYLNHVRDEFGFDMHSMSRRLALANSQSQLSFLLSTTRDSSSDPKTQRLKNSSTLRIGRPSSRTR